MKKILGLIALIFTMTSCYDDYVKDYKYDAVYFTYQYDVRTFVVGEGMSFDYGVALGGVMNNTRERVVHYEIDPTLITPEALSAMQTSSLSYIKNETNGILPANFKLLPANFYSVTDANVFVIAKGQNVGRVTIRPDSALFLSSLMTLKPNFVLPLVIKSADVDTVLAKKKTTLIAVKYENKFFGNYWHGGITVRYTPTNAIKDTLKYYTAIPSAESKIWVLKTAGPFELTINGYSNINSGTKQEIKITQNGNQFTIGNVIGSKFVYSQNGICEFNNAKLLQNRKIIMNYKYVDASGYTCYATDTLTFRNRIRDGVNEWQDENPSNYK